MRTYGVVAYSPPDSTAARHRGTYHVLAEPHVMIRIGRVFPRARTDRAGRLTIAASPEVACDLEWLMDRWPMRFHTDDTRTHLTAQADLYRSRGEQSASILAGQSTLHLPEPARPPRDYQRVAGELAIVNRRLLIGDDVGLGKTYESLLVLAADAALPALVVTLAHLPCQWLAELAATWPMLLGHVLRSREPYDVAAACGGRTPDVFITSYAKLAGWQTALAGQIRTVIFDEAQELRHAGTSKHTAAANVADRANYAVQLTASPVYNYGGEIHNVLGVIAPDALGTREEFLREWCGESSNTGNKPKVRNPKALGAYLRDQGLMLRRTRRDVARELPEPIIVEQPIGTDHKVLDKVDGDVAEIAALILAADATPIQRMQASSELDWKMRQATGIAKALYVADFVRLLLESEERIVLFGWHRAVYDLWRDRLHTYSPVLYTGSETPAQKARAVDKFTTGQSRVLIMSLRSGVGLDGLQNAAKVIVFGELDWSPQVHRQNIGRLRRDGQTDEQVVAYFLVSEGGTDPHMAEVLEIKRLQADPIMDPNGDLFTPAGDEGPNRIRALAAEVVRRARRRGGVVSPTPGSTR